MHCFIIDYYVLLLDCAVVFDLQVFLKVSALCAVIYYQVFPVNL
jgi:hypothetical protein